MHQWWRAYNRARHDPKLLKLSDRHFRWWFNLVCAAADNNGVLPSHGDLAVEFRISGKAMTEVLDALIAAGLFDHDDNGIHPHNWSGLQYKSDVSTERVKRFRDRDRNVSCNVTGNVTETPSETDTETETESEQIKQETDAAFAAFAASAAKHGWPQPRELSPERRKKLRARLKQHGMGVWRNALERAEASTLINEGGWWSLDWLLKPANFAKVIEGNYDNRKPQAPAVAVKFN